MANQRGRILELIEFKRYTGNHYSRESMNDAMGAADRVIVHAIINEISTDVTVQFGVIAEDSSDSENWVEIDPSQPVVGTTVLTEGPSIFRGEVPFPHGRFLRLRATVASPGTVGTPYATYTMRASLKNS